MEPRLYVYAAVNCRRGWRFLRLRCQQTAALCMWKQP